MKDFDMTPLVRSVQIGCIGMLLLALPVKKAEATSIPKQYRGVWAIGKCDPPDPNVSGEFPYIVIGKKEFVAHKSRCRIVKRRRNKKIGGHDLTFKCNAEGMTFIQKGRWSVINRVTGVYSFKIEQPFLYAESDNGKGVYKRCALTAREG